MNGTKLGLFSDVGRPSGLPSCLGKAGGTPAPLFTNLVPFGSGVLVQRTGMSCQVGGFEALDRDVRINLGG